MNIRYTRHALQRMQQRNVRDEPVIDTLKHPNDLPADPFPQTSISVMQIDYDPEADAIYIRLREGDVDDTIETSKYIFVDVDSEGVPLGLEILFAGRVLKKEDVTSVIVNISGPVTA